jgi:DNA-binding Lrp family transcriptional regulator
MDVIDKNILTDLMINCRTTYQEMALKYNLSANAIKKRINNMISKGVIERFTIQLSLAMIDAEILMSLVNTDGTEDEEKFIEEIGNDPRFSAVGQASGNLYIAYAKYYNGTIGLSEIRSFFTKYSFIKNIELYPLLMNQGGKAELSRTELTILKFLMENPRMPISEISSKSGISSRMVSAVVNDLVERGIIMLSINYNPGAGDSILFLVKIEWDDTELKLDDLLTWLPKEFPDEYWVPAGVCVTSPTVFGAFISSNVKRIPEITKEIRRNPSIKAVTPIIGQPNSTFPDYSVLRLKELLREIS